MTEEVTLTERVGEVLLPGVLGIARAEHRVDSACRQHGMRVAARPAPDDDRIGPGLGGSYRRAKPGGARPNDQDVADSRARRRNVHGRLLDEPSVPIFALLTSELQRGCQSASSPTGGS